MSTITSLLQVRDRLRADDTPTPPSRNDTPTRDTEFERMEISNPTTPTRNNFAGIQGQLPLPDEPLDLDSSKVSIEGREDIQEQDLDDDIDMRSADIETVDDDASENESITSDSQRPSKKKKGQRFFCTEFPPCQLSFTRSEHLARHIRKHTGERPFQCHCSRRFSRLDNLRQHAQTVHVNEEIPGDSLAATSTRFQRQIRTDRVRSTTSRPRGSTMGGNQTPTHSRGHSRNLSTSSIGSVGSFTTSDEPRRRQPQLAIATEGLKRPLDTNEYASEQYYSPGVSTPTSQIFSSSLGSPGYQPTFTSPSSRSSYYGPPRHNRRLSVPTGPNPFTNAGYAPGFFTPISPQASIYSQNTSGYASPTSSIVSPSRRESESEIEYRRRTWHPSSQTNFAQRPATSGLSYHQTPDEPRPALSQQPAASQITRLPGIESFDHGPRAEQVESGRPTSSYDNGLQQGLTRLDITANQPEPWQTPLQHVMQPQHQHHISMPEVPITPRRNKRQAWYGGPVGPAAFLQPTSSHRPSPEDSGSSDGGVSTPQQPPGQDYIPVIANEAPQLAPREYHQQYAYVQDYQHKPTLPTRADSGFGPFSAAGSMTAMAQQSQTYQLQTGHDARFANGYMSARPERNNHDMGRLEALVAVATSENRAVEGQR